MLNSPESKTSPTLLEKIRDLNREDAWARFYALYQPVIRRWCSERYIPASDLDDITSDVFARLLAAIKKEQGPFQGYDPGRSFRAWLKTVVNHAVSNYLRTRGRRPGDRAAGGDEARAWLENLASPESVGNLTKALEDATPPQVRLWHQAIANVRPGFKPENWQAFELYLFQGLPVKEIARRFGLTVAAVTQARYRIVKALKEEVERLAPDYPEAFEGV